MSLLGGVDGGVADPVLTGLDLAGEPPQEAVSVSASTDTSYHCLLWWTFSLYCALVPLRTLIRFGRPS